MIYRLSGIGILLIASCLASLAEESNRLTEEEREAGFRLLFNGKDLAGWQHRGNWIAQNGELTRSGRGGSLVYMAGSVPEDFELKFEWKVAEGSNSGIYYRPGQYEYQILDNDRHRDGKNPRTSAASLYFCMAPSHDATGPVGTCNTGRIVCQGSVIQHWLNGHKVIDFDYSDARWAFEVEMLRQRGAELTSRGARLFLQDHGDPVWYRGIKLREIPEGETINHSTVEPEKISASVLEAERVKLEGIVARRNKAKQKK